MNVKVTKKSYSSTGSILATIEVLGEPSDDTALFVVTQAFFGDPTIDNNVKFLSVASAADFDVYGNAEIFPGIYRTDKITVCIDTETKYNDFMSMLMADLNKSALLSSSDFTEEVELTYTDDADEAGPFFFGSTL